MSEQFFRLLKRIAPELLTHDGTNWCCKQFDSESGTLNTAHLLCEDLDEEDWRGLDALRVITGELVFRKSNIENLSHLNKLESVGKLTISGLPRLIIISGINSLSQLGALEIRDNRQLENISGLSALLRENDSISGVIKITGNPQLGDVNFLRGLKHAGSSLFLHHNAIGDLAGLSELESVNASLSLSSNKIRHLGSLSKLQSIDGMLGVAFNDLKSLDGLQNLKHIRTTRWNGIPRTLAIHGNEALNDISALGDLRARNHHLLMLSDHPEQYRSVPDSNSQFGRNTLEFFIQSTGELSPAINVLRPIKFRYRNFESNLKRRDLLHFSATQQPGRSLLISFSDHGEPVGGCLSSHSIFAIGTGETHCIFLRDESEKSYESGIPDISNTLRGLIDWLEAFIKRGNYEHIVCLGNGIGANIALTAGVAISATRILCLAPSVMDKDIKALTGFTSNPDPNKLRTLAQVDIFHPKGEDISLLSSLTGKQLAGKVRLHPVSAVRSSVAHSLMRSGLFGNILLGTMNAKPKARHKVLFSNKWQAATTVCPWLDAHHLDFRDKDSLVEYCHKQDIHYLFANNYYAQKSLLKNEVFLRKRGFRFLVNNSAALSGFVDKQKFHRTMIRNGFEDYIPRLLRPDTEEFPCIVKPASGGAGRGVRIARSRKDIEAVDPKLLLSEYLPGNTEFATSLFCRSGRILKAITFQKSTTRDIYILQDKATGDVKTERVENQFLDLFESIVRSVSGVDDYCCCSFNYKIVQGIPKIFEVNPRIGYTLARSSEDFLEMMDVYIAELQ